MPLRSRAPRLKDVGLGAREMYRRALLDPCYAALPSTPYSSGAGGVIGRIRNTAVGPAATNTAEVVFFHPVYGSFARSAADATTVGSLIPYSTFYRPMANESSGRAISGCLSATFLGPESTRGGLIHCGVVSGAVVISLLATTSGGGGSSNSIASINACLSHVERTPVDKCEVNWFPGEGDSSFAAYTALSTNSNQMEVLFERTNFVVITVVGVAAGTIEWNATGVVESTPAANQSLFNNSTTWDVSTSTKPRFDYRDVVSELGRKDPSWFLGTFKKVSKFISGVATGYATAGMPGALGYLIGASPADNVSSRQMVRGK